MTQYIRSLGYDSPVSRLMAYVATLDGKAETMLRAQTKTEKNVSRKPVDTAPASPEYVISLAKRNTNITDIAQLARMSRGSVQRILGMAGVEMRHLSKPFSNQTQPSIEIGNKIRASMKSGIGSRRAGELAGVSESVAMASLAMVGGLK